MVKTPPLLKPSPDSTNCPQLTAFGKTPQWPSLELCLKCVLSDSVGKESPCNAGDPGLIPESGRSPGEGNGNPLQDSCWESSMNRGAWWATVHGDTKNQTQLGD